MHQHPRPHVLHLCLMEGTWPFLPEQPHVVLSAMACTAAKHPALARLPADAARGGCRSTFNWRGAMQPLAEVPVSDDYPGCHVIAFDRPPFGLSQRPLQWAEGRDPYTTEGGARLAAGLLDALGVKSAVVVGHSMGATVSVELLKQCAPQLP